MAREQDIVKALTGNWREEHLFVLTQALPMYDDIAVTLAECHAKLDAPLAGRCAAKVDIGKMPRPGSKARLEFDIRQRLADWAGVDLTRINGLGVTSVLTVLSEIGPDLSRFAGVKHFCSWLGLGPGTKISGRKVLSARTRRSTNRVRQALTLAAMSLSRNGSAQRAFYRRMCARMVYFMLARGEDHVDQGQQHYEDQQRRRSIVALRRRAADIGFMITPATTPA